MCELPKLDIRVIASSVRSVGSQPKNQLYEWGFTALLQRYGFSAKGEPINFLVIDWESERRDIYCEVYQSAFYMGRGGETYFSGPLRNLPAIPYLSFSVTVYNPILQVADFVVGCIGDFLKGCYGSDTERSNKYFPFVKRCFARSPSGQILRWGLIIQPKKDENIIEKNCKMRILHNT